jgi:hypothetical protein
MMEEHQYYQLRNYALDFLFNRFTQSIANVINKIKSVVTTQENYTIYGD